MQMSIEGSVRGPYYLTPRRNFYFYDIQEALNSETNKMHIEMHNGIPVTYNNRQIGFVTMTDFKKMIAEVEIFEDQPWIKDFDDYLISPVIELGTSWSGIINNKQFGITHVKSIPCFTLMPKKEDSINEGKMVRYCSIPQC